MNRGEIIYQGEFRKKNKFLLKNLRFFTLANDGDLKYYKDGKNLGGQYWLTKDTNVVRTSKTTMEIRTPEKIVYIDEINKGSLDEFINAINHVI